MAISCIQLAKLGGFYGDVNHGSTVSNWETGRGVPTLEQFNKLITILDIPNKHPIVAAEREVIGKNYHGDPTAWFTGKERNNSGSDITIPATEAAKQFDGAFSGFQPKPAVEIIIVVMKPLSEKTYVDQALKNGKGVTWLGDCRIPYENTQDPATNPLYRAQNGYKNTHGPDANSVNFRVRFEEHEASVDVTGRVPANL